MSSAIGKPGFDIGKKVARKREHPLDVFFSPDNVALIGATENPGQRRTHDSLEPHNQPLRRNGFSR